MTRMPVSRLSRCGGAARLASPYFQAPYLATQRLIREFEQEFGGRACHELLGCDLGTPDGQAFFRENRLGERCLGYTGKAAEIAARILSETKPQP